MNKLLIYLTTAALFLSAAPVRAHNSDSFSNGIPDGWTAVNADVSGNSITSETTAGREVLTLITTVSNVLSLSGPYQSLTGKSAVRVCFAADNAASTTQTFRLITPSEAALTLVTVTSGVMKLFEASEEYVISPGVFYELIFTFDQSGNTRVYLDNVLVYDASRTVFDYASCALRVSNQIRRSGAVAKCMIDAVDICSESAGSLSLTSSPADGDPFVPVGALENITLAFNGAVLSDYAVSLFRGQTEVEADISRTMCGMVLAPAEGFLPNETYTLEYGAVTGVFGGVLPAGRITFTTIDFDYTPPSVEISSPRYTYTEGDTITVTAEVTEGSSAVTRCVLYDQNGQIAAAAGTPYVFSFTKASDGTYEIYAIAEVAEGLPAVSNTIAITVQEALPPVVTLNAPHSGKLAQEDSLGVTATSPNGNITLVKLFIDGAPFASITALAGQTEFAFPLAEAEIGRHTLYAAAFDDRGLFAQTPPQSVIIAKTNVTEKIALDFNTYTSGTLPSAIGSVSAGDGYLAARVEKEEFGKSFIIGAAEGVTSSSGTNANFLITQSAGRCVITADIMLTNGRMNFVIYPVTGSGNSTPMRIENEKLTGTGLPSLSFAYHVWHKLVIDFDINSAKYDLYLDGDTPVAANVPSAIISAGLRQIRFHYYSTNDLGGYVALDNFTVHVMEEFPYINGFEFYAGGVAHGNEMSAPYALDKIRAGLSGRLDGASVGTDTVKLLLGGAEVALESVSYDNDTGDIVLIPKNRLRPVTQYRVELRQGLRLADSATVYGMKSGLGFQTRYRPLDITSGVFAVNNGAAAGGALNANDSVTFGAVISDQTGQSNTVTAVLILYDSGGRIESMTAKTQTVAAFATTADIQTEALVSKGNGRYAEAFVIHGWTQPHPISPTVYTYGKK